MRLLPSCREVTEAFARGDYEDAPLLQRLLVRAHLWHCGLCTRYWMQLRLLAEAFRRTYAVEIPVGLKTRLENLVASSE